MDGSIRLEHIGIAVEDLESALTVYRALGFGGEHREIVPEQKIETVKLSAGEAHLELMQPTEKDSPVGKFLDTRGQGVHHLAFAVPDIDAKLAELKGAGFRLIDNTPRQGAGGYRVAFLHPKGTLGTLIELVERG